ncbi:MAG: NFACT RNA binding domain-containing protein [Desulfovibrionaceae bacterium]
MESTFFRLLARELGPLLCGKRIEKIFHPAPDVQTLCLGAAGFKHYLILKAGPQGTLFLSQEKPPNPAQPDSRTMWLRKRLMGRWLREPHVDWPGLRIAWELSGNEDAPGRFLLCDLRQGLILADTLDAAFDAEPDWPPYSRIMADPDVWRDFPHVSPPLRRTLEALGPREGAALLARVRTADLPTAHVYMDAVKTGKDAVKTGKDAVKTGKDAAKTGKDAAKTGDAAEALAWPLPDDIAPAAPRTYASFLDAARAVGEPVAFAHATHTPERGGDTAEERVRARAKRIRRTLRRLQDDIARLETQAQCEAQGRALQANLYRLKPSDKLHKLELLFPDGTERTVELDPSLTISANMERLFRLAAKAKRGLAALAAKREALSLELADLLAGKRDAPPAQERPGKSKPQPKANPLAIHRFRTDDGFLLLRGKNSAANHKLLSQAANPFDLWFHAQGTPGAHLILKRDHPNHEVPRQSLIQAAILAALKSAQATNPKANVICALVKHVRKIKGAPLGMVAVDAMEEALTVVVDEALEERLRIE